MLLLPYCRASIAHNLLLLLVQALVEHTARQRVVVSVSACVGESGAPAERPSGRRLRERARERRDAPELGLTPLKLGQARVVGQHERWRKQSSLSRLQKPFIIISIFQMTPI